MQPAASWTIWDRLTHLRRNRRMRNGATLGLVLLGPVLVLLTFLALGPLSGGATSPVLRIVLLADLVYVLVVTALIGARIVRMIAQRRAQSEGSRLHLRLTGVFALIALVPTVSVAIFAGLTINVGLEGWFSDRVREVVGTSLAAAEAYQAETEADLVEDARALGAYLDANVRSAGGVDEGTLRILLAQGQSQIQRGLREAFVIDGLGRIVARGERSYLFDFEDPGAGAFAEAREGAVALIRDWEQNEFRALLRLAAYSDRYLYVSRTVDGEILSLLDETQETVRLYQQLERDRGRLLFEFSLLYLGFAVILILAAVWLGLWFAERLSRPVGRLASAAERVGAGDLEVQVPEEGGDDEIAVLGRVFNQMTRQLNAQRAALLDTNRQVEARRRLFDSVLTSVTAGVMGLDAGGRVDFVNRAGARLLALSEGGGHGRPLAEVVPEFASLRTRLMEGPGDAIQEELRLSRAGRLETLLVRIAERRTDRGRIEGHVIAFDDVTDLVSAQRMAAWGDVARRIAHEIKNPLTPIQLSAERIKRRFRPLVGDEADALADYTDVIIRQTNDLRRIVDEFSRFARMPEPDRHSTDIAKLLRDAVTLQEAGQPDVRFVKDIPDGPVMLEIDGTMLSQAFTNLLKNGGEAIESLREAGAPDGHRPEIRVALAVAADAVEIAIADNGTGLPPDRSRLFEPYVTTRAKGTGLGLPIVKKIIEEHGGTLTLEDAPAFATGARPGALARIRLPHLSQPARRRGGPGGQS